MFVVYFAVKVSVIRVLINYLRSLTKVKVSKKQISNINVKGILNEEKEENCTMVPNFPENEAPLNAHRLVASVSRLVIGHIFLPEVPDQLAEGWL